MDRALLKKIGIAIVFISIVVGLYIKGFFDYFTFEEFVKHRTYLREYVAQYPIRSRFIFFAIYMLEVLLFIPAGALLGVIGGFLFGMIQGLLLINIAATLGAVITFLAVRYYIGKRFQAKYADQLVVFNKEIEKHGTWYLLIARLIPMLPFFIANVGAGLAPIRLMQFLWTTSVGIIPITATYVYIGSTLNSMNGLESIFSSTMIGIYLLLASLIIIPILIKWYKERSVGQ